MSHHISFLGLGNMNAALLAGLLASGYDKTLVRGTVRSEASAHIQRERFGITVDAMQSADQQDAGNINVQASTGADVVMLGVKPYQILETCAQISSALAPHTVVVSVAAGVSLGDMAAHLPAGQPVVRAMPNTPFTVGRGAVGLTAAEQVTEEQLSAVRAIFEASGTVFLVAEEHQELVTAVAGSGPAYVYLLAELLADAATQRGLDHQTAQQLVAATVEGAAAMMVQPGADPVELRRQVTSPNGTTHAAITSFLDDGLDAIVGRAIEANIRRIREIAAEG